MADTDIDIFDDFDPLAVSEAEEEAYNQGWFAKEYGGPAEPPRSLKLRRAFEAGWRAAEKHAQEEPRT